MEDLTLDHKQWNQSVAEQWGLFLPPARPSLSELVILERYLFDTKKHVHEATVAILGSTPEYRDLCQTHNAHYSNIDYRAQNFHELRSFMLHKDNDSHLIESDWRTMEFPQKFDLFFGDLVTTVVPVKDHDLILANIAKHCNKNARVVLKVPLRRNNKQLPHQQIFEYYRKHLFYLNPFAAVWHEVLMADYDITEDTMHCQTSLQALTKSYHDGIINEFEWNEFKKRWDALGDFKMNIPLKSEYLKKVSRHFSIEKITSGSDWYKNWSPVLVLRKK